MAAGVDKVRTGLVTRCNGGPPTGGIHPATRNGTPFNMKNFLRRVIKAGAKRARARLLIDKADLPTDFLADVNHQVFRRNCATYLQKLRSVKDIHAHLRHSTPATTVREYMGEITASLRSAVELLDNKLTCFRTSKAAGVLNTFEHKFEIVTVVTGN